MGGMPHSPAHRGRHARGDAQRFVLLMYRGRPAGLYEVREAQRKTVLLASGPVRFDIGSRVTIDDYGGAIVEGLGASLPATVIACDDRHLTLAL